MAAPYDPTQPPHAGGPPPPPGDAWGRPVHPSGLPADVRGWGIGAHLGGLVLGLSSVAVLGFLAPLVVWLVKRDDHPFVAHHAKEALNFQLTVLVAAVAAGVLAIPVVVLGFISFGILWVVAALVVAAAVVAWFVFPIVASVKASNGEGYRYPLTIRFIS